MSSALPKGMVVVFLFTNYLSLTKWTDHQSDYTSGISGHNYSQGSYSVFLWAVQSLLVSKRHWDILAIVIKIKETMQNHI